MKNIFYVPEKIEQYAAVVEKLRLDLKELTTMNVPENEVIDYVDKLLKQLKENENYPDSLFLMLVESDECPSDIRVEYFYMPTYISLAILTYSYRKYESVRNIPNIEETIRMLMNGSIGRQFRGHGYMRDEGIIEAVLIFVNGAVHRFLMENHDINPDFNKMFDQALSFITNDYANGNRTYSFGGGRELEAEKIALIMMEEDYRYE